MRLQLNSEAEGDMLQGTLMPIYPKTWSTLFWCTLALAGSIGCRHIGPTPYVLYPGPAQAPERVATLDGPVATIDGTDVSQHGSTFALLPGCHVVVLQARIGEGGMGGAWSTVIQHRTYAFQMKAGHTYAIQVRLKSGDQSLGTGSVGEAKIEAFERDEKGQKVGALAPVRSNADVEACHA
jgi:hypothetical protein